MSNSVKICVSLGTNDPNALKNLVSGALNNDADHLEVRFDYLDKQNMNPALEVVLDHKEKSVFTCRAPNEGGKYDGQEQDRVTTLRRLAAFRPMLLDVELKTLIDNDYLKDDFEALNCQTLVSWHNLDQTPSDDVLAKLLKQIAEFSTNAKIITTAKSMNDNLRILKLYGQAKSANINLIAFCMGEEGILSRVLCTYAGAPFTYASLEEALAPGQLTINEMKTIYDKLEKQRPDLKDYNMWKDKPEQDFDDIIKIINEAREGQA